MLVNDLIKEEGYDSWFKNAQAFWTRMKECKPYAGKIMSAWNAKNKFLNYFKGEYIYDNVGAFSYMNNIMKSINLAGDYKFYIFYKSLSKVTAFDKIQEKTVETDEVHYADADKEKDEAWYKRYYNKIKENFEHVKKWVVKVYHKISFTVRGWFFQKEFGIIKLWQTDNTGKQKNIDSAKESLL